MQVKIRFLPKMYIYLIIINIIGFIICFIDKRKAIKNKYRIKELIIEEASADELIDVKKYKKKRQYFFRTIEVLLILIFSFLIPNTKFMLAILIISIAIIIQSRNFIAGAFFSNPKHAFKKKSFNDEMFKNCSKIEIQNIITEFFVCIIIYFLNFYLLENLYIYKCNLYILHRNNNYINLCNYTVY